MPTFKAIEEEISNILELDESELTEEQKALYPAYLNELGGQEADKVDSVAQFCRFKEEYANALNAESKRLARRAKTVMNNVNYIMGGVLQTMQEHGLKKIAGNVYIISIRSTPVVRIDNESAIPAEYWRVKEERTVDKVAIRDAIKCGAEIPGAAMGTSFSLQVR